MTDAGANHQNFGESGRLSRLEEDVCGSLLLVRSRLVFADRPLRPDPVGVFKTLLRVDAGFWPPRSSAPVTNAMKRDVPG